ncbi:MAG: tetratricopeptide repeat protein [Tannerellaceae bacterium]|jgi:TolA-binding protein|nr:tetratricopeptide repeat protein [Tannerellaceae bacterium]
MMKRLFIPLCLIWASQLALGQRSYQFSSPDRLFVEGQELFELKNYTGCIDKLQTYKQQTLQQPSAQAGLMLEADYMLACAAYEQGLAGAPELLKEYLDTYPDTHHADEVNFFIGSVHFGRGEYEKAAFWLNEANLDLLSAGQQEAYTYRLAYSLLQTGDTQRARTYFSRIKQVGYTYREAAAYYVAYIDYAAGRYNDALAEFVRLKDTEAYRESSQYFIAQIYFIQAKYERVVSEGEELLSLYPDSENNSELYRITGNAYYHLNDRAKAIDRLMRYVASAETPLRNDLYLLGVSLYNNGDYAEAINYLKQTVREDDALTQNAYLYLGQSYLKGNDKNNARMAFEAAATASFDEQIKEAATYNYALLIHETAFTGFGESVAVFENFLNHFPNSKYSDKGNDYLVEVYLTTKNYQAALTSIEKINRPGTRILEAKQDILFQLGTQAFANVKMDDAIKLFTRAIDLGAFHLESRNDAYFWRGESFYRQGLYQNAIADYRTYLNNTRQRNTDMYALAYYNMGYGFFKQQRYDDALRNFRQYTDLERNPKAEAYADAYNRIGDCLFYDRRFVQAEESYTRAAAIQPGTADYSLFQKGYIAGLLKDYRSKIAAMNRLLSDFPDSRYLPDALYEKGRSYVLLDNSQAAAEAFEALMSRFPQNSRARKAGVQLGLLYNNNNQPEKAIAAYKKVIGNYPESEEARVALQDLKSVYIDLNDIRSYAAYANSLGGSLQVDISEQDSLTYIAAERLFMRADYEGARRSLSNYLQSFPTGAFSTRANYHLASIHFTNKNYAEAKRIYNLVLKSGDTKFVEDSWARKAEIEYMEKDYKAALESFKQLRLIAEDQQNREAAKLGVMRCAQFAGQSQDALDAAEEILKGAKLSPEIMGEARYIRAKAYLSLNQPNKALSDLQALSKDTRTANGAEAKYLLAQLYYNANENAKAEKELMNFIENGTPHQYWLARGFILLADVYIRQGDDFQARQYLTSLRNNYKGNDDIADMIENRLGKLKN